jgi:hypothetical protein
MLPGFENDLAAIKTLINTNISNTEALGSKNDFSEAENIKNKLCAIIQSVIELSDDTLTQSKIQLIKGAVSFIENSIKNINQNIARGIHENSFPARRQAVIDEMLKFSNNTIDSLTSILTAFQVKQLAEQISGTRIEELTRKLAILTTEAQSNIKDISKAYAQIQDKVIKSTIDTGHANFQNLEDTHSRHSTGWFIASIAAAILLTATIVYAFFVNHQLLFSSSTGAQPDIREVIVRISNNLLLIAIPSLLLRITLRRYNIERHLRITYAHRSSVLKQYPDFEVGIGDDAAAKNNLRIQVANFIFSDPVTGYIKDTEANDVNVNPIISIADKITDRRSG